MSDDSVLRLVVI